MVESAVLRWTGHVTRMSNDRIPKRLLYGRLASGRGSRGNHISHLNQVRRILRASGIPPSDLEVLAARCAENDRTNRLIDKHERCKCRAGMDPTLGPV